MEYSNTNNLFRTACSKKCTKKTFLDDYLVVRLDNEVECLVVNST